MNSSRLAAFGFSSLVFVVVGCSSTTNSTETPADSGTGNTGNPGSPGTAGDSSTSTTGTTNTNDTGTGSGTVAGVSFTGTSGYAAYGEIDDGMLPDGGMTTPTNGLNLVIADKANSCTVFHSATTNLLAFSIVADPVTVGTYSLNPNATSQIVFGEFIPLDAMCNDNDTGGEDGGVDPDAPTDGTVTVTAVSATLVTGTYTATFPSGTVTGSFNAPICAMDPSLVTEPDGGFACDP